MTPRHRSAQDMLIEMGDVQGYTTTKTFTKETPGDAVWLVPVGEAAPGEPGGLVPVLAAEVVVSEGKKSIRGSISTLEDISPAVGVIVVHTDEVVASRIRRGIKPVAARRDADQKLELARRLAAKSRQRVEVWDSKTLQYKYHLATQSAGTRRT